MDEKEKVIISLLKGCEACMGGFVACLLLITICLCMFLICKSLCYYNQARNKDKYLSVKEIYDIVKKDSDNK